MKIAVQGCAHGELERIYDCIESLQRREGIIIDLLLCCGDFHAIRNRTDMSTMSVPDNYLNMGSFYKYYSGEKKAPVLTLFIGGKHEPSNYLQELPHGGWVAPNIYYLGRAGVVQFGDLRIGGLSGIYKERDYLQGLFECPPYNQHSCRSVNHVRSFDVFRLSQLKEKVHIMLSHDWPRGITDHGNREELLRCKPSLRRNIESNRLGSMPARELLDTLKPDYWFSARMHCKFVAVVNHVNGGDTKFTALDKCMPRRKHLQLLDVPCEQDGDKTLKFDAEWLAVLKNTNHLLPVENSNCCMPRPGGEERHDFTPTIKEKEAIVNTIRDMTILDESFIRTAPIYNNYFPFMAPAVPVLNPQTVKLCDTLGIDDPVQVVVARSWRIMKIPDHYETVFPEASPLEVMPPLIIIKRSKLWLPSLVSSTTDDKVTLSPEITYPENILLTDGLYMNDDFNQRIQEINDAANITLTDSKTEECSLQIPVEKKTFKRPNASIYTSPDQDNGEGVVSSSIDSESSPCKLANAGQT